MSAVGNYEFEELVELAREKSQKSRSILISVIDDLYSGEEVLLTEQDRAIMIDIIRRLIHQVEISVRRSLAEKLAGRPDAPEELVLTLANDEIGVAHPILINSEVLKDPELIEIVQYRTMEHQVAIAMRPRVSEQVSDALVETKNERVVTTLLSNQNATISDNTMGRLVEQSAQVPGYQEPLTDRHDLSTELAKKLYFGVSAALRKHIIANFDLDPTDLDENIEAAVNDALVGDTKTVPSPSAPLDSHPQICEQDLHRLDTLLRNGNVEMFVDEFVNLSKLSLPLVRRFLFEPGGEGLAIACKGISLNKATFASILLRFRAGRLGDKKVDAEELSHALSFFDKINSDAARSLVQRWQRDPDFLNALRQVEQAKNG